MKLRYLHLSDLYFSAQANVPHEAQSKALLKTIEPLVQDEGSVDFVIITGNMVDVVHEQAFAKAETFCQDLLNTIDLPPERLYLTPGSRDVDRSQVKPLHVKTWYPFENQDEITELLSAPKVFPLFMHKFGAFNAFAKKAMGRQLYDAKTYHMVESLPLEKQGTHFRVALAGLNSSLFAGHDAEWGKLALGRKQVDLALSQLDTDAVLSIGFFHHPWEAFHSAERLVQTQLRRGLDLILHGQLSAKSRAFAEEVESKAKLMAAGAPFSPQAQQNRFNRVEIDLGSGQSHVQVYGYQAEQATWNKEDEGFSFVINSLRQNPIVIKSKSTRAVEESPPQKTIESQMHFIHDYLLPDAFTGRTEEQARLKALLRGENDIETQRKASLLTVRALGGMGKSCLIRKVVGDFQKENRFEHIVWFSFYEAHVDDESSFFRHVLEAIAPKVLSKIKTEEFENARCLHQALRKVLAQQSVLLVLDGIEVIQRTKDQSSPRYGEIQSTHGETNKLLRHLCNHHCSVGLISSRVPLSDFAGVSGYLEMDLKLMEAEVGAEFLERMGVQGTHQEFLDCVRLFGGHALTLKTAGQYMQFKHIPASQVERLTGDLKAFKLFKEGEKLNRIVDAYRSVLSNDQRYFLEMMSIHSRSVDQSNFSALVPNYGEKKDFQAKRDEAWTMENIIDPLERIGLIEAVKEGNKAAYSAHPLMKLAFLSWLDSQEQEKAHDRWAKGMSTSPAIASSAESARSLADLQPYLDAVEHYLEAGNTEAAWDIYRGKGVDDRLYELGESQRLWEVGRQFEKQLEEHLWKPTAQEQIFLYAYLGHAANGLGWGEKKISYRTLQFEAAQASNNPKSILIDGCVLVTSYLNVGQIKAAQKQLALVEGLVQKDQKKDNSIIRGTLGKMELFLGNYEQSRSIFQQRKGEESRYNKLVFMLSFIEALTRSKAFSEAESKLTEAQKMIEQHHIPTVIPVILAQWALFYLKQNRIQEARVCEDQRQKWKQSHGLPFQPDGFLLVQEKQYEAAIQASMPLISSEDEEKFDKFDEIEALLVLAQAWQGKGNGGKAQDFFHRATALMDETGCWHKKDHWEESKALIEG